MDRAYEGDETHVSAASNGCEREPVVQPRSKRKDLWEHGKETYKQRNVVERLFRGLKEFRKVCTGYDKTDIMFLAFI